MFVLDTQNRTITRFNLTDRPIAVFVTPDYVREETNYAALRQVLLDAAGETLGPGK